MSDSPRLHVLLIDDDPIVPQYERQMLLQAFPFAVCDLATTVWEGKEKLDVGGARYDLILLDLLLPDGSGTDVLDHLRITDRLATTPVIITSGVTDSAVAAECRVAGARGYVPRLELPTYLIPAVRAVLGGHEYFPSVAQTAVDTVSSERTSLPARLEPIARLLGAGKSAKEVAAELGMSEITVRNAFPDLMRFYDVNNRGELMRVLAATYR